MTLNPNIDLKSILGKAPAVLGKVKRYGLFIGLSAIVAAYGFILFQIQSYSNQQPNPTDVKVKLQGLNTPKVDSQLVDKIQKLEGTNIEVKTLFDQARDNPFQE